jgi:arylsulfatase A-like enzyme
MRRAYKHLVLFALVSMLVGLGMTASHAESSLAQTAPPFDPTDPNIIFILTDDMRYDDFNATYMPKTYSRLVKDAATGQAQGMSFKNAFVSTPLCCPTRATIMRGQYAHNTGIWFNVNGPHGGWEGYNSLGYEKENVATQLDAAGYHTGLFGKYLNQYGAGFTNPALPPRPVGWDEWFAFLHPINYLNYDVYDNDIRKHFGTKASDYSTDVLKSETLQFIADSVGPDKPPFFAYVAPKAPHDPFASVPRHQHDFDTVTAPRLPSFDEKDVSDKPPWIQDWRRVTSDDKAAINDRHEKRVESLRSVDDLVGAVVNKLPAEELANTYIVFTSDNGWYHGEHRIRFGKGRPYEEAPHVPLVIRGPSVQAGSSTDKLVLDTDYFPTFMDMADTPETPVPMPSYIDGRTLLPVLTGSSSTWTRTAILLEGRGGNDPEIPVDRNYNGIRTINSKYVEYEGGFKELYNLNPADNLTNPYELTNIYNNINNTWGVTEPPLPDLDRRLDALKSCQPEDDPETPEVEEMPCQTAEDGP